MSFLDICHDVCSAHVHAQVPAAVKCLYNSPLPDVSQVPSVADSMLTASEDMERWRMEEERNRKMFVTPRSPALTHNQDEVQCTLTP